MVRRAIYEAVEERIEQTMPWVKFIDLQKGQFDTPGKNYPLPLPCALIEIKPIGWKNVLNRQQNGEAQINIWVYLDHSGDSFKGAEQQAQSLELLDHMDDVFQNLTDLTVENVMQRMVRSGDGVNSYKPRMMVFKTEFTTLVYDSRPIRKAALPPSILTAEITTG